MHGWIDMLVANLIQDDRESSKSKTRAILDYMKIHIPVLLLAAVAAESFLQI